MLSIKFIANKPAFYAFMVLEATTALIINQHYKHTMYTTLVAAVLMLYHMRQNFGE